jgi:ATP/maltotriose-dependent transcriptional regulator MalT
VELERPRARPGLLGRLLRISGFVSNLDGDPAGAATVLAEAVEISRVLGDELGEVSSLQQLAWNLMEKGDLDGAERLQHAHLDRARRLGAHRQLSGGLHTSGCLALHRGDFDTAARRFAESIQVAPPYARFVTDCMAGLAVVATRAGRFDRALRLIAAARHLSPGIDAEPWWPVLVTPAENLARRALSTAATEAAVLAGAQLTVSQAITYALAGGKGRRPCPFSARERQVAGLITDGLTNRQISGRLTVSLRTVETVVANIRAKIGVPSRVQVALWVAEHRAGGCCGPTS